MPMSADQFAQFSGQGALRQTDQQAGTGPQQFGGEMADALPEVGDKLTAHGRPPGGVEEALGRPRHVDRSLISSQR